MMLKPLAAALAATLALAACDAQTAGPVDTGADPLAGSWRVLSIGGTKIEDPNATLLTFTGLTTLTGTFGCNQFTANYTYDRNVLFVTNLVPTTAITCSGAPERQERNGLRLLSFPATVVADANGAILSGREGQSFSLQR